MSLLDVQLECSSCGKLAVVRIENMGSLPGCPNCGEELFAVSIEDVNEVITMSATLLKKISPKTVMGEKVKAPEKETDLYSVFGIASGVKSGETAFGPWTKLIGNFEATRVDTGEVFRSGECFLPEPLHTMIATTLMETNDDGRRVTQTAQFSVMVSVKPSDAPIGYEYNAKTLAEVTEADPLAALRKETAKALPAPAEDAEEPAPAKKETAKKGKK